MTSGTVCGRVGRSMLDGSARSISNAMGLSRSDWKRKWRNYNVHILIVCVTLAGIVLPGSRAAASGWSEFAPSSDSRIIYVSSSQGSDNNNGLSPQQPVKTINEGYGKLRDGMPDWLLLRRGDTWYNEGFSGSGRTWAKDGRSADEPIRLGAYGSDSQRPRIVTDGNGFDSNNTRNNVAVTGIHFQSADGGGDGFRLILGYGENWLIEDCKIEGYQNNLNVQGFGSPGDIYNFALRRCVVVDAASTGGGHSQGIFIHNVHGLLIEDCVFDHNGWSQVNNSGAPGYPTIFNHNLYIASSNTDAIVRGNIISNASSHGIQLRCGGIIEDNVFTRNPLNIQLGGGDPDPDTHTNGVTGEVRRNIVLDSRDINPDATRGFGIDLLNIASATVRDNIVANRVFGNQPRAMTFKSSGYGSGVGLRNVVARDNIVYKWGGSVRLIGSADKFKNLTLTDNDFQNDGNSRVLYHDDWSTVNEVASSGNRCFTGASSSHWFAIAEQPHTFGEWTSVVGDSTSTDEQVSYPDPDRTLATYNATLGGPKSQDAFMEEAREQSQSNWRWEYTAEAINEYVRAGFGVN